MRFDRRTLMTGALLAGTVPWQARGMLPPAPLPDAQEVIELWPGGFGPGLLHPIEEVVTERPRDPAVKDRALTGIARPRMAVFRAGAPNGAAVLIAPGGGYARVVIDREGYEMARWLAARGFTAFVLFYRLPAEGWADPVHAPLADAQRAIRLIRRYAADYGIDPARVAAMGFSAGGHVCASLATRFAAQAYTAVDSADSLSARPVCAAPIYPVVSMHLPEGHTESRRNLLGRAPTPAQETAWSAHQNVPADAPPHFLCAAEDDPTVPVANTLLLRDALKAQGARVETHLFELGGHGFGLRLTAGKPVAAWPQLWMDWAETTPLFG